MGAVWPREGRARCAGSRPGRCGAPPLTSITPRGTESGVTTSDLNQKILPCFMTNHLQGDEALVEFYASWHRQKHEHTGERLASGPATALAPAGAPKQSGDTRKRLTSGAKT